MERYINIKAVCDGFTIIETVAENKCVKRLTQIRNIFEKESNKRNMGTLRVNTVFANPELPFASNPYLLNA